MRVMRRAVALLDLVVPPTCAACGLPGPAICPVCAGAIGTPAAIGCRRCCHPWAVTTGRCAECPPAIDRLQFAAAYVAPLPALITALKDGGRRQLADDLAAMITMRCQPPEAGIALVPVPVARERHAKRGFNQAALIADNLGQLWSRPVVSLLHRTRNDPPQRGASITDRTANVRGAFVVKRDAEIPAEVWLVDDVCTTGATLGACARTLRHSGVRRVGAVIVARVLRHQ